ncbi:hypothetical protein CSOJ01_14630 [Colletotrichum sojae]|uniref:Uncharacterized protein n=1 Tax=Colletotrichum sojae TaxID=2175907 RepID=A0A8H6IPG4_9PEZI|nr:hypothetical protein CSOJ01_14630 [Colletotrichum sojae]
MAVPVPPDERLDKAAPHQGSTRRCCTAIAGMSLATGQGCGTNKRAHLFDPDRASPPPAPQFAVCSLQRAEVMAHGTQIPRGCQFRGDLTCEFLGAGLDCDGTPCRNHQSVAKRPGCSINTALPRSSPLMSAVIVALGGMSHFPAVLFRCCTSPPGFKAFRWAVPCTALTWGSSGAQNRPRINESLAPRPPTMADGSDPGSSRLALLQLFFSE